MKFVFSFVLVFFYVSCSGSNAGLETPPQQQIKQIQQKSEQQIQQIKQETTEDIEEIQKETKKDIEEIQKETETPPPQQIKEIKQKSGQQIKEIKQKSEQQIEEIKQETKEDIEEIQKETKKDIEEIQKETETPPPQQIKEIKQKSGQQIKEIKQKSEQQIEEIKQETKEDIEEIQKETETPPQQQTKQQKLPTSASPAPPSFAKQLEQITGVYHKKVDVYWSWFPYDSWIADLSTKTVLAYSPMSDTLMFWIRSMDASEPGRFCVLLSDFNIADFEPDYIDDEGRNESTHTIYEARSLKKEWVKELQMNNEHGYIQGLREGLDQVGDVENTTRFISLFVTDTGELESMTLYMSAYFSAPPDWIHSGVEPFRFKSSERSEEIPSDPEAFFSEQLNKSPCRFI